MDVEAEVVSVNAAENTISFSDDTGTPYEAKVDEKTKMKAKKKVFKGELTLEELKKGDKIQVRLDPVESRLLDIQLLARADS